MKVRNNYLLILTGTLTLSLPAVLAAEPVPVVKITPDEVAGMFEGPREVEWVPGEVIVKFKVKPSINIGPAGEINIAGDKELEAMGLGGEPTLTSGGEVVYRIAPTQFTAMSADDAKSTTLEALANLQQRTDVEYVQLNYIVYPFLEPNDQYYPAQWHYRNNGTGPGQSPGGINLPVAWDHTTGNQNVVVAVIDTGILPNHPDISGSGNLVAGYDMITSNFTANDVDGRDADPTDAGDAVTAGECGPGKPLRRSSWHGTHVAGTIGVGLTNNVDGVAGIIWQGSVQSVRVLGKCGGNSVDINDGIRWAAGLPVPGVPDNATPADVINMSLGAYIPCSNSPALQAAINDAVNAGTTVVVAAGNDARNANGALPAGCDNVITVAAADYNGNLVGRYSNFGDVVEIMAPGGDVLADVDQDGNNDGVLSMVQGGYAFYNGTSMAAPHVAGVAALLLSHDPNLTPQQVSDAITANAIPRTNQQCPQPCGAGLLNADFGWPTGTSAPTQLSVSPASVNLNPGKNADFVVSVTVGSVAQSGVNVSFTSADTNVATVSPVTGATDNAGQVTGTITGVSIGTTSVEVSANGQNQTITVSVRKKASALGWTSIVVLVLVLLLVSRSRRAGRRIS